MICIKAYVIEGNSPTQLLTGVFKKTNELDPVPEDVVEGELPVFTVAFVPEKKAKVDRDKLLSK